MFPNILVWYIVVVVDDDDDDASNNMIGTLFSMLTTIAVVNFVCIFFSMLMVYMLVH